MIPEGLGFLIIFRMLEDMVQGTNVDCREARFLTGNEANLFDNNLKTHIEQPSVTEGCAVLGNPLFVRQCVFWVEPEVEVS